VVKIASFNVENLFQRATALSSAADDAQARQALEDQAEINEILRQASYGDADKDRILELLTRLGLRDDDDVATSSRSCARTAAS
jgi:ribosome assembly protein YihI (activator of Der GTPase)